MTLWKIKLAPVEVTSVTSSCVVRCSCSCSCECECECDWHSEFVRGENGIVILCVCVFLCVTFRMLFAYIVHTYSRA